MYILLSSTHELRDLTKRKLNVTLHKSITVWQSFLY